MRGIRLAMVLALTGTPGRAAEEEEATDVAPSSLENAEPEPPTARFPGPEAGTQAPMPSPRPAQDEGVAAEDPPPVHFAEESPEELPPTAGFSESDTVDHADGGRSPDDLPARPVFGINAGFGLAFGGDDLVRAEMTDGREAVLEAGRGVVLTLGAMVTPLWFGRLGLGVSGDIGWKYTSITASNGTVSLSRFPVVGSLHALYGVSSRWYLRAAGGVYHELGVRVSGDQFFSDLNTRLDSSLGFMGEAGALYTEEHWGASFALRYTALEYARAGVVANANNGGLFMALHYAF